MGKIVFRIPPDFTITNEDLRVIHAVGSDRLVRRTQAARSDDLLVLKLNEIDGVKVKIPFRTATRSAMMLATCTLRVHDGAPYNLILELARGTVFRLRSLYDACKSAGVMPASSTTELLKQATQQFAKAVVTDRQSSATSELARTALDQALQGLEQLEGVYAAASQKAVERQGGNRAFLRGVVLDDKPDASIEPILTKALNTVVLRPRWKNCQPEVDHFEWDTVDKALEDIKGREYGTVLGPLVQLDQLSTPDWLYLWENDFSEVAAAAVRYVEAMVTRYRGQVDLWYCAAGLNSHISVNLKEEQRLQLLLLVIQAVRGTGLRAPLLVSFNQPWGEYLATSDRELAPLHFAEELVRARIGISGIGLEMNFGTREPATYFRGFFEVEEILDHWSLLGVPLFVTLTAPSSWRRDPDALYDPGRAEEPPERLSRSRQRHVAQRILPAILTHPQVQGVFWNQVSDTVPHAFPYAGLIDNRGRAKSTAAVMQRLLETYFQ